MPIYEYACPHCRKTFEEWLKSDDEADTHPCPDCGAAAHRVISHTSFILKGGGWYVTEYGSHHAENEQEEHTDKTESAADGASPDATKDAESSVKAEKQTPPAPTAEKTPAPQKSTPASNTGGSPKSAGKKSGETSTAGTKTSSAKGE